MESVGPGFPHVIPEVFYLESGSEANTNIADWSNEDLQTATASVTAIRDAADTFLNSPGEGGSDTAATVKRPQQGAGIDAQKSRNEYCALEPLTVHHLQRL